jgi:hypothetical protein
MEFDPKYFMADVNAALAYVSPDQLSSSEEEQERHRRADTLEFLTFEDENENSGDTHQSSQIIPGYLHPGKLSGSVLVSSR